jgi:hypothetical protein
MGDHTIEQYVFNGVSTQNVENFWSQFKRGLYGVYRHCGPAYLQHYANECAFRYSYRESPINMFCVMLGKVAVTKFDRSPQQA